MFLLRPSTLAAALLSCTHLHFISSYVLSLLYMFETPKSFQLRPWPQICTPILTAATLYCMHLHFISPLSCLCFEGLRNPNSSGRGGRRNTPTAVKYQKNGLELKWSWIKFGPLSFHHINPHGDFLAPMGPLCWPSSARQGTSGHFLPPQGQVVHLPRGCFIFSQGLKAHEQHIQQIQLVKCSTYWS